MIFGRQDEIKTGLRRRIALSMITSHPVASLTRVAAEIDCRPIRKFSSLDSPGAESAGIFWAYDRFGGV
jgi:hypothetical protein